MDNILYAMADTRFGRILVAATARGVCRADFCDTDDTALAALRAAFPACNLAPGDSPVLRRAVAAVDACDGTAVRLDLHGTPFQKRVWQRLLAIPRGQTRTYGQIAREIGLPHGARAVGSAVGANTIAVLIPCHRVLPATGGAGAFRWGTALKQRLLDAELFGR